MSFLLGFPIFRDYVKLRAGIYNVGSYLKYRDTVRVRRIFGLGGARRAGHFEVITRSTYKKAKQQQIRNKTVALS